jgi:hypothetical protein
MRIKSNTMGKLRKIYEGKSFDDKLVIVDEIMQNSKRADSNNLRVTIENDTITFLDDGCGCDDPANVFTLDFSAWKSTDEGFGIGIFSFLNVEGVERIDVYSKNWLNTIIVEEMFKGDEPTTIDGVSDEYLDGFKVVIKSPYILNNPYEVIERVRKVGELQAYDVYINGDLLPHRDLHAEVKGDFIKTFDTKYFKATLSVTDYGYPEVYYERRHVARFYPDTYVEGIVEVFKGTLTLKEPDRKSIVSNRKKETFKRVLHDCIKELYIEFIKVADNKQLNRYAESISRILEVKDYEKFLMTDDFFDELVSEKRNVANVVAQKNALQSVIDSIEQRNNETQVSLFDCQQTQQEQETVTQLLNTSTLGNYKWVATDEIDSGNGIAITPTAEELEKIDRLVVGGIVYKKVNIEECGLSFEQADEESVSDIDVKTTTKKKMTVSLNEICKSTAKKAWVKASEAEEYADLRAKAEYYGVKVLVSKNLLHDMVYKAHEVPYITEIKNGVQKRYFQNEVTLKTGKEELFIKLLSPITKYYNLPLNTFLIGNLKLYIETKLQDKVINREILENKKGNIKIFGVCKDESIILDRKAINLTRFNLGGNGVGINEIKAIFANIDTISHELAHLVYGTEDNTNEHFQRESQIRTELTDLYLTL